MKDIETREDLEILMAAFYNKLLTDHSIGYIFTDVARIDLQEHLPHIVAFWEQSLFNANGYKNNVLQIHLDLNGKEKLTAAHFETWLRHFNATVSDLFIGDNAEKIKTRALSIATIMQIKINN